MNNNVIIKGSKHGIKLSLNKDLPFDDLKKDIAKKFKESADFFKDSTVCLEFDGRKLTGDEQNEVVNIITENSTLNIACILDNNEESDMKYRNMVEDSIAGIDPQIAQFYKGTVRSGQVLESPNSLVVLGDVNPGGKIIAGGSVVVIGSLKGIVFAGGKGNDKSFVIALDMDPLQIKICDIIARSSANDIKKKINTETKIAFIEEENIYIEPLNKDVLNDIEI